MDLLRVFADDVLPVLLTAKFSERNALGLLTGAGSLGILFPPCLPLILYGLIAQVPVREMFLGGIVPGPASGSAV